MPAQFPQFFEFHRSAAPVRKNAAYFLVVPVDAEASHFINIHGFGEVYLPVKLRRYVVVPGGETGISGIHQDRGVLCAFDIGGLPEKFVYSTTIIILGQLEIVAVAAGKIGFGVVILRLVHVLPIHPAVEFSTALVHLRFYGLLGPLCCGAEEQSAVRVKIAEGFYPAEAVVNCPS
jgi:hypothetical protein